MMLDKWLLNLDTRTCNCSGFMKSAVCGHILGYTYRNIDLDQQCWFGPKFSLTGNKFQSNIKRGRKKYMRTMAKRKCLNICLTYITLCLTYYIYISINLPYQ